MLQLHPAVIVQVDGRGLANIIVPVAVRDAVDQLFFAKGRLHVAAGGFLHRLLILAVKVVVIKASVCVGAGLALGGRLRALALRRKNGTAAAAALFGAQGALAAAGAGAQSIVFVRERPFIARAMGGGVDAAAKLFVALAVIGCAAVRADHDIIGQRQRSAAAFAGTAIIFRHDFLLLYGSYWYYTPLKEKRKGENLQNSSRIIHLPLYFSIDSRYTNEVSVYKLCLLASTKDFTLFIISRGI